VPFRTGSHMELDDDCHFRQGLRDSSEEAAQNGGGGVNAPHSSASEQELHAVREANATRRRLYEEMGVEDRRSWPRSYPEEGVYLAEDDSALGLRKRKKKKRNKEVSLNT